MTFLTLSGISKKLAGVPVLTDVSLSLEPGSRMAIVGASGSGKSTLLRLVAGFDRPDEGTVHAGEVVLSDQGTFVPAHRRGIGYVAQDGALFPHLTVRQNVRFGLRADGEREARVREVMRLVGLADVFLERYPHELSGGQQQRVALARALAPSPRIVLLDEPFSALDTGLRAATREAVVTALDQSGVTTILVTHDQDEALSFGQQIAVITDGSIAQSGAPVEVFRRPASPAVATFLGNAILLPCVVADGIAHCHLGAVRLAADAAQPRGRARLLLRPAQVAVLPAQGAPNAIITNRHFAGQTLRLQLRLTDGDSTELALELAATSFEQHPEAFEVRLTVSGEAIAY